MLYTAGIHRIPSGGYQMLSGCKPQYCKTVGYTWLYTCDCKAFGSDTRFGDLKIGAGIEAMHAVGLQNTYEQKRSDGSRQQ